MRYIHFFLFCFFLNSVHSQTNKEKAQSLLSDAINDMEEGHHDKAITLLREAKIYDAYNFIYDYEIGFAQYLKKDFKSAAKTYETILNKYTKTSDQCYQMLGNLYDLQKKTEKALKTYNKGLEKHPKSGRLYLEKGILYLLQKQPKIALEQFEKGIYVEPDFASNYYRATLLYCNSAEPIQGLVYGEIFMNLERNTERTQGISKILFQTYSSRIQFDATSSPIINLSGKKSISQQTSTTETLLTYSFEYDFYIPTLYTSLEGVKKITLETLHSVRVRFLTIYNSGKWRSKYPNVLFEQQLLLRSYGHFEAYNYWLMMYGDRDQFNQWKENNQNKWDAFVLWFRDNPMMIGHSHRFHSKYYE